MILKKQDTKQQWRWFFIIYLLSLAGFALVSLLIKALVFILSR